MRLRLERLDALSPFRTHSLATFSPLSSTLRLKLIFSSQTLRSRCIPVSTSDVCCFPCAALSLATPLYSVVLLLLSFRLFLHVLAHLAGDSAPLDGDDFFSPHFSCQVKALGVQMVRIKQGLSAQAAGADRDAPPVLRARAVSEASKADKIAELEMQLAMRDAREERLVQQLQFYKYAGAPGGKHTPNRGARGVQSKRVVRVHARGADQPGANVRGSSGRAVPSAAGRGGGGGGGGGGEGEEGGDGG
eukprot:5891037-Pleurochrysis_carterae.AAC.1